MIRSGTHNDRLIEQYEEERRRRNATGGARPARAKGAGPTLLGVMTDEEVCGALLRRISEAGADARRRMLADLTGGMPVRLVFGDWLGKDHRSVYSTEEGVRLSMGQFHSGTTFEGTVRLDPDDRTELEEALASGYTPVFHLIPGAD
jgi:hypothetical protein